MKTFSDYINEKQNFIFGGKAGLTGKEYNKQYNYFPKSNKEFKELMEKLTEERGLEADFNDIDTSNVTNMKCMFWWTIHFNGDISRWDTSQVTNMGGMFYYAESFNQDISGWDTSNVTDMSTMFYNAKSFNQDISQWNVSKVEKMDGMFHGCPIKEKYKPKFK